jgi:Holliday junction DNA helicase RuvA
MLEYIKGNVSELTPTYAVLEANQVGYFIHISLNTYASLEGVGAATLYIYEAIREDAYTLYGFMDKAERQLFALLVSVSGIGPNTARMILSSFSVPELENIIVSDNVNQLKGVKGIGLKTAQRVIIDLKDKVQKNPGIQGADIFGNKINTNRDEALSALVMLGFNPAASAKVIDKIVVESPGLSLEKIIKEALKRM